jgi:hypothetical protein
MAFRTLSRCTHEGGVSPGRIGSWPLAVDEERAHDQREPDYYRDEDRTERHSRMIADLTPAF